VPSRPAFAAFSGASKRALLPGASYGIDISYRYYLFAVMAREFCFFAVAPGNIFILAERCKGETL
jgi:hypothetical protein